LDKAEFKTQDSDIIGCLDPLKLEWIKLVLEGNEAKDPTLEALSHTLSGVTGGDCWSVHLKTDVCEARPLTPNERTYLEVKKYCQNCQKITEAITYIELVKEDPANAYNETREIFDSMMSIYELDLMLNNYLHDIKLGYETRKSGFKLNFVVLRYFLWPYLVWTYVIKIYTQVWGEFGERFLKKLTNAFTQMIEWWLTIPPMLSALPQSFAGGEAFEQHTDPKYKMLSRMRTLFDKRDTVEHFGFLKGLISIGEFFKGILDAVTSLMFAITNPIKFLMMLIGFVMSLILIILYSISTVFFLHYVLAAAWMIIIVLIPAIFMTTFYGLLPIPMTVWYGIVWLLDLITGGMMMALYRCENSPDKWYKYSSYAYGNMYERVLFCTYRCAERYEPWSFLGIVDFCSRIPKIKPSYCPQQNIFKIYKGESLTTPSYYKDFEVNLSTANMTNSQRETYLTQIKASREEYTNTCKYCFENDIDWDSLKTNLNYNHISRFLCKYTAQLSKNNPLTYKQICDVCTNMYGGDVPMYKSEGNTLNTTEPIAIDGSGIIDIPGLSSDDEVTKSIIMFIVCILFVIFIAYMIKIFNTSK
jgi:hypothetical protein